MLPRELLHIVARFAPADIPFLVRASRTWWTLYCTDAVVWGEAVKYWQARQAGAQIIRPYSGAIALRCPSLAGLFPCLQRTMAKRVLSFAVASDGKTIACLCADNNGSAITLRLLAADALDAVIASVPLVNKRPLFRYCALRFSPTNDVLACMCAQELVFPCVFTRP